MKNFLRVFLSLTALAGCAPQGVTVQRVEPGDKCPAGGIELFTNGKDSQLFCNGTPGKNGSSGQMGDEGPGGADGGDGLVSLVTQQPLPNGDSRCPRGGVEVSSGLDTNRDGTLASTEVTATSVVCNADDNARPGSLVPPAGANGTATLKANGGLGDGGIGGPGGGFDFGMSSGTNGGHVKLWRTGHADATFTRPTPPAPEFGATPLAITTDTTLLYANEPSSVNAGTYFVSSAGLFLSTGPNTRPKEVTGLSVAAGVTLTFPTGASTIAFGGSCRIDGTLKATRVNAVAQMRSFTFICGDAVFSSSSRVAFNGSAAEESFDLTVFSQGSILALGSIDTSGATNAQGEARRAGDVRLSSVQGQLFVSGSVRANGGSGTNVGQGRAGNLNLLGRFGVFNDATLEANAGTLTSNGEFIGTEAGGTIVLLAPGEQGEVRNRGAITANGASLLTANCSGCFGGNGGTIRFDTAHAGLTNDAALTALGGPGTNAGGSGGYIEFRLGSSEGGIGVPGSLLVSGSLDVSGGAGSNGGQGGSVGATVLSAAATGAELVFLGYERAEVNGGDGLSGGNAGHVQLFQNQQYSSRAAGGAVVNTLAIAAHGGTGVMGSRSVGGQGGRVTFDTQSDVEPPNATWEVVLNSGAIDVRGGAGESGGSGGFMQVFGRVGVTSSADFDARGGLSGTVGSASGGSMTLRSLAGRVTSSGAIELSAGSSMVAGADVFGAGAGELYVEGARVAFSSTVRAVGGAVDTATATGGPGGFVTLRSNDGRPSDVSTMAPGGIVVSGGAGLVRGSAGAVTIDDFLVTPQWTR